MSTVVCEGFLEPHLLDTTTMKLKVVTPKVDTNDLTKEYVNLNNDALNENWNFLQALNSSSPQTPKKAMKLESLIIPPLDYNQSSIFRLSEKSLELCTESLGSETGSYTSESSIFSLSLSTNQKSTSRQERNWNSVPTMEPRRSTCRSFPPPLTTMSGSNSIQVKPRREGGRLIIQAIEAPSTLSYFQTERSEGRLRLSFWENVDYNFYSNVSSNEECEEYHQEDEVHVKNDKIDNEMLENALNQFEEEGINYDEYMQKMRKMDGNSSNVEVRKGMEMKKFQRETMLRNRCKEDEHGDKGRLVCNWEAFQPFCVATS